MILHQASGYLISRQLPNPQSPAHAVAVFQHRWIRSGDARPACVGEEARDGGLLQYRAGAGRRGQAYGNDGSSGTDEDFGQPQWIGYAVSDHFYCFLSLWCYDEVVAEVDCSAGLVRTALWAYAPGASPIKDSQKKTVITANKAVAMRCRNSSLL
jgi:hypothetical protein